MSREINFRVWDLRYGKWARIDEFYIKPSGAIGVRYWSDAKPGLVEPLVLEGRFILQQYTGLKDHNGVEIYEGDIIKRFGGGLLGNPSQVLGTGVVTYKAPTFLIDGRMHMFNPSELEVIGNIHQHPELLQGAAS